MRVCLGTLLSLIILGTFGCSHSPPTTTAAPLGEAAAVGEKGAATGTEGEVSDEDKLIDSVKITPGTAASTSRICRTERPVGTHIPKRICRTRVQADLERDDARRNVRRTQIIQTRLPEK